MAKKMKMAVLAVIALLAISDITFARGGYQERGNRNYRPEFRHNDCRPDYHYRRAVIAPHRRGPAAVYPSRGLFISPFIVISFR
ncbi:MAG: hypothetical protein NTW93_02200 [Phycisphaerae bacterium]|nr:hypothetical protein [Phycisphaerae bacterium]